MIRSGKYTMYKNKEYKFVGPKGKTIEIISHNKDDMMDGFIHYQDNVYTKTVSLDEVESMFFIYPKARYKGELFSASEAGKQGKVLLDTSNTSLAEKLGFDRTDKYLYSKYVDWSEVDIIEEKEPFQID